MSYNWYQRLYNFIVAEDEAANALLGGKPYETVSGSVGRALLAHKWWAPAAAAILDWIFGAGHCASEAAKEAYRVGDKDA